MTSRNEENVRRGYAAFRDRDWDEIIAVTHPDIVFTSLIRESEGGVYRGHDGLREFFDLRDGLAIRWDFFRTEEEARAALAAAG